MFENWKLEIVNFIGMQIFEANNKAEYDSFLIGQEGPLLQSWHWGEFQKKLGRKVWRLLVTTNTGKYLAAASVIKQPLAYGKEYFYCPRGPVIAPAADLEKVCGLILDKISDFKVAEKPVFLRIDPLFENSERGDDLKRLGFQKLAWEIQPKDTFILDLSGTEDRILRQMKPKTRYNINLAERKGVTIEQYSDGSRMKIFWELLQQTTARDSFSPYPYVYYLNQLNVLGRAGQARLFVAFYQRRPLAAAIVAYFGKTAYYLHGASSDRFRAVMAPYFLQWSAIGAAKSLGMENYDFCGIAPEGVSGSHAWAGITRFKKGFGGKTVSYIGAFDLPYNSQIYRLYRLLRKFRRLF